MKLVRLLQFIEVSMYFPDFVDCLFFGSFSLSLLDIGNTGLGFPDTFISNLVGKSFYNSCDIRVLLLPFVEVFIRTRELEVALALGLFSQFLKLLFPLTLLSRS